VSRAFGVALERGRIDDAYALTTLRFRRQLSLKQFRELIERYPALRGPAEAPYQYDSKVDHDPDFLRFTHHVYVSNHGHSASFTYIVIMEEGQWKVDALTFR
jgi:hypothetical protein